MPTIDYETLNATILAIGETKSKRHSLVAMLYCEDYNPDVTDYWVFYWPHGSLTGWCCTAKLENVPEAPKSRITARMKCSGQIFTRQDDSMLPDKIYIEFIHGYRGLHSHDAF